MLVTADRGPLDRGVVSLGVPFAPGELRDAALLRVLDERGDEVPAYSRSLARWPADGSQRSVLVAFRASLAAGASAAWSIEYGAARRRESGALGPAPEGPAAAALPPAWYARSLVAGYRVGADENEAFAAWGEKVERALDEMSPPWQAYGLSCETTALERTYYDGPHALFQRFLYRGTAEAYRRAREESAFYRANELRWFPGGRATYACAARYDAGTPMPWQSLRTMLGQGMLDDYLLTGDPEALRALRGLGEAFLRNLPALEAGPRPALRATERNLGWTLMGLASYYAVDPRPELRAALDGLVGLAAAWQAEGESGAFEHDVHAVDPDECGRGPRGASPFMTSLLVDGLMDAWLLTRDPRVPPVVLKAAAWYRDRALNREREAFQYLWRCEDVEYQSSAWADLNLLICHVFGAAYLFSGDAAWLDFGDHIARKGLEHFFGGRPKNWSQATRSFTKYLGYRALGRRP
ncbi:MAG TPA: hypothetical protein VFS43_32170 [Polyangiaceae bacterium]|nr:hypothetical protein [Polyangiaceae bacterium]